MQATAFNREVGRIPYDERDHEDLARDIASLREDVYSVSTDIQQILEENTALKQELSRRKNQRSGRQNVSEIRRLKGQVDRLIDLHESLAGGEVDHQQDFATRAARMGSDSINGSWMKKMMMVMMLAEMV